MALASIDQPDFGAGIHRGREAPANAAYDLVNALIDDEGQPFKRGGSAYWSASNAGQALARIATAQFVGPDVSRVLAWASKIYTFDGSAGPVQIYDASSGILARPASQTGLLFFPLQPVTILSVVFNQFLAYGGSLLPSGGSVNQGTITVTNGSTTVTKAGGTTWVGNVDAGMFLQIVGSAWGIVRSVDGANALTLAYAWTGPTASTATYSISPSVVTSMGTTSPSGIPSTTSLVFGAAGTRLLAGVGNRVYMSERGAPNFDSADYHELPTAARVKGIQGVGDSALIFAESGVWVIDNLSLDPVDAFGNIQQSLRQVSGEVILWGEAGITPFSGAVIVPAIDDIYVLGLDGSATPITGDPENEKVRRMWRGYTKTAGYQPGIATVLRGHLWMPIVSGTTVVDVLVCRLDRGAAWTRWSGHAAGNGFAVLPGSSSAAPVLLGIASQRVTNLSATFDPVAGNASDADATVADCTIITRDFPTGQQPGFFAKARARYELEDDGSGGTAAPTVAIAFTSDADAGTFTTLTDKGEQGGAAGWGVSAGDKYQWATVGKARERGRLRITVSGACARFVLRSVELLIRQSGKQ